METVVGFAIPALILCTLDTFRVYVTGVPRVGDQALRNAFFSGFPCRSLVLASVLLTFLLSLSK